MSNGVKFDDFYIQANLIPSLINFFIEYFIKYSYGYIALSEKKSGFFFDL